MKKIFALVIVLTMVFALTACGGDKPSGDRVSIPSPSGSQQNEGTGGDEGSDKDGKAWPSADYITPGMKYTGKGEIVVVNQMEGSGMEGGKINTSGVYIDGGDIEDVKDYIAALKEDGFTWYDNAGNPEPDIALNSGSFLWYGEADGGGRFITITVYEEQDYFAGETPYTLYIQMMDANMYKV